MPGVKRLRSVANSLAQHALSGSCGDAPERSLEQRRAGVSMIAEPLLVSAPAIHGLASRFAEILQKEGWEPAALSDARAEFLFNGQCRTASGFRVVLSLRDGSEVQGFASET